MLHDWQDDQATAILRNCRSATHDEGRALVVETVSGSLLLPSMAATEFGDNKFQLGVEPPGRGRSTSHAGVARRSGPARRAVRSPSGSQRRAVNPNIREG